MNHLPLQVDDETITADYVEMEGIGLVPDFDRDRYKAPFLEERLHPTFFVKGCTIPDKMSLDWRPVDLSEWHMLTEEWGAGDYYGAFHSKEGDLYYLDRDTKLLTAVVDLSPKVIEAAFVKLAGRPSGGVYSKYALLTIGAALWRTDWCPGIDTDESWPEFVQRQNAIFIRNRKREEERQAAVLAFLDEVG